MAEELSLYCRFQTCPYYTIFIDQQSMFMHIMEILKMYILYFSTLGMYSVSGQNCTYLHRTISTNVEEHPTRNTFLNHELTC